MEFNGIYRDLVGFNRSSWSLIFDKWINTDKSQSMVHNNECFNLSS